MAFNTPLHHMIVKRTSDVEDWIVIPELHLRDDNGVFAPYQPLNLFFAKNTARTLTTKIKAARGIGYFYDYAVQQGHRYRDGSALYRKEQLMTSFANHLLHGTISWDTGQANDQTGLLWTGHSDEVVKGMLYAFDMFISLMMPLDIGQTDPLVRHCESIFTEQFAFMTSDGSYVGFRLLSHLNKTLPQETASTERARSARSIKGIFTHDGSAVYLNAPTYRFPRDMIGPMAREGFKWSKNDGKGREQKNASGEMLFHVLRSGIRISETLHMWVNDLQIIDGRLIGFLRHPERFREPETGLTRLEVLRTTYGMAPRTRALGGKRVGWKSPGLNKQHWSLLSWLPGTEEDVLKVFARYIIEVRNPIMRARKGGPPRPSILIGTYANDPLGRSQQSRFSRRSLQS